MSESNANTRLELLRIARELVINEYIDKRAQDHNNWLSQSEIMWKTKGIKLPYPPFPPYPTEADIIARANALEQYLIKTTEPNDSPVLSTVTPPAPEDIKAFQDSGSLLANTTEAKKETKPNVATDSDNLSSVLPTWLSKNSGGKK